ncbi:MAG: tetratricopeptide repeat protein [Candidatus Obscuribacterales bacterium]|nr:tetratricopeptide repeat protein [Candidatus Obscuribacterales bacterium]
MQKPNYQPEPILKSLLSIQVLVGLLGMVLFYATIVNPEESVFRGKAVEQTADDGPGVMKQAELLKPSKLAASGKLTEAMIAVDQLLEEQPYDLATTVCRAEIYLKSKRAEDAFKSYKRALALAPRNRYIRIDYARALTASNKLDEAIKQYKLLQRQSPTWADPHLELAQIYMLNDKPLDAAVEFAEVSKLRPNDYQINKLRGIALARGGRAEEGMDEYMNGINVEARSGKPEAMQAILRIWGNVDKAKYDLERQIESNPDDPMLKMRLAQINIYINKTAEAKQYLQETRKLAPNNPEVHRLLCIVYQKLGDQKQALTEFMQSVALEKAIEDKNKK